MDAKAFLVDTPGVQPGRRGEWLVAAAKTAMGVILIRGVAPAVLPAHALLAGWIAMSGVMFLLHFGTFHLLSLAWRQTGIDARPIMRHPLRSVSLAEFWGRRWNIAFHELATRFTFAPLRRVLGVPVATVAVFVVSGLVHELVITLPARGGLRAADHLLPAAGRGSRDGALAHRAPAGARAWSPRQAVRGADCGRAGVLVVSAAVRSRCCAADARCHRLRRKP